MQLYIVVSHNFQFKIVVFQFDKSCYTQKAQFENRGDVLSFYEFMQNFVGDDTPLGELVAWMNQDTEFPRDVKSQLVLCHIFVKIRVLKTYL